MKRIILIVMLVAALFKVSLPLAGTDSFAALIYVWFSRIMFLTCLVLL